MHWKRWVTAVVTLPIIIYVIGFAPSLVFYGLLYLVILASLREYYGIAAVDLPRVVKGSGYLLLSLLVLLVVRGEIYLVPAIIVLWAFVPMTLFMLAPPSLDTELTGKLGKAALGLIYVGLPLTMLCVIYRYPRGSLWIFFLLAVIFASDTGAFYSGRLLGKHKLYKAISPGKTWEGAGGGLLAGLVVGLWFLHLFRLADIDPGVALFVAVLVASGQVGDLVESMLKRSHGVKDSGRTLPGHGGILDRIDGLLFAVPILYIYLTFYVV
jgi:phosphatidate cytidylyltransferase